MPLILNGAICMRIWINYRTVIASKATQSHVEKAGIASSFLGVTPRNVSPIMIDVINMILYLGFASLATRLHHILIKL